MKSCSICNQIYNDDNLNFCLDDGGVLIETKDDAPPTIQMNRVRTTQPNFSDYEPSSPWGSQPLQPPPFQSPMQQFAPMVMQSPNQTLAIVSLSLGIASVTIGWCCSFGVVLSPAALVTGFIALSQIKKDPQATGGKSLAMGGIITAAVYLGVMILLVIIYGMAFFFGSLR